MSSDRQRNLENAVEDIRRLDIHRIKSLQRQVDRLYWWSLAGFVMGGWALSLGAYLFYLEVF
jgi:hypothetical protein